MLQQEYLEQRTVFDKGLEDKDFIIVVGVETSYKCGKDYVIVPYTGLFGEGKALADGLGVMR